MLDATSQYSTALKGYLNHPYWSILFVFGVAFIYYIVHQRFFHPLSGFPGPYVASITNWWKVYHVYQLDLHEVVLSLHQKYGPVVRIGPNDLHFWNPEALTAIYKAGRTMPKTGFYDAFTTFNPNLFGTTDDDVSVQLQAVNCSESLGTNQLKQHALRRRQMSHGFSMASVREMEPIVDGQMKILCDKLDESAKSGIAFDLKVR